LFQLTPAVIKIRCVFDVVSNVTWISITAGVS